MWRQLWPQAVGRGGRVGPTSRGKPLGEEVLGAGLRAIQHLWNVDSALPAPPAGPQLSSRRRADPLAPVFLGRLYSRGRYSCTGVPAPALSQRQPASGGGPASSHRQRVTYHCRRGRGVGDGWGCGVAVVYRDVRYLQSVSCGTTESVSIAWVVPVSLVCPGMGARGPWTGAHPTLEDPTNTQIQKK